MMDHGQQGTLPDRRDRAGEAGVGLAQVRRGIFFFSSGRRHTRSLCDWSSDVCSSDLMVSIDRSPSSVETSVPGAKHQGPSLGTALAVLVADCPSPVARSLGPSATSVGVVSLTSGRTFAASMVGVLAASTGSVVWSSFASALATVLRSRLLLMAFARGTDPAPNAPPTAADVAVCCRS